jgi:hypothetical protein
MKNLIIENELCIIIDVAEINKLFIPHFNKFIITKEFQNSFITYFYMEILLKQGLCHFSTIYQYKVFQNENFFKWINECKNNEIINKYVYLLFTNSFNSTNNYLKRNAIIKDKFFRIEFYPIINLKLIANDLFMTFLIEKN